MSLDFKLHYDRLREGDPTKPETAATANQEALSYEGPSYARSLCLVWLDGKRQFLSYTYLIGGEFMPGGEANMIKLNFSAYSVTLTGYGLQELFNELISQTSRQIVQTDKRYVQGNIAEISAVVEINVEKV